MSISHLRKINDVIVNGVDDFFKEHPVKLCDPKNNLWRCGDKRYQIDMKWVGKSKKEVKKDKRKKFAKTRHKCVAMCEPNFYSGKGRVPMWFEPMNSKNSKEVKKIHFLNFVSFFLVVLKI